MNCWFWRKKKTQGVISDVSRINASNSIPSKLTVSEIMLFLFSKVLITKGKSIWISELLQFENIKETVYLKYTCVRHVTLQISLFTSYSGAFVYWNTWYDCEQAWILIIFGVNFPTIKIVTILFHHYWKSPTRFSTISDNINILEKCILLELYFLCFCTKKMFKPRPMPSIVSLD